MLNDPFDTTYRGSMQAGMSLGQGINDAAGSFAQKIAQDKQRKDAFNMLKQFGMVDTKTEEQPSLDQLAQGAKDFAKQQGHELTINYGDNPDQAKQNIMGIYKALNIPLPQGKTTTTLNLAPGTKYDPIEGDLSIDQPSKTQSMVAQLGLMKDQDKKDNAKLVADAIENGNQLADFQSLYGLAGPVKAELEKRGVNVNKMQLDTMAEKKLVNTLNGQQQTRLRQSIQSVTDGLDTLDGLNKEFQRTGVKAFNKAQIEALANGAGTPEQQDLAQRFMTQIVGLQDEFGGVIMNGNSPTDKSLELSSKVFGGDFNNTSLSASIKQAKQLLNIRRAAVENVGPVGVRGQIENQTNQAQQTLSGNNSNSKPQVDYKSKYGLD